MKLATLKGEGPDGRLVVVSRDLSRALDAAAVAPHLRGALEDWARARPALEVLARLVEEGAGAPFDPAAACAPLPRSPQWCDASAFLNHAHLMQTALGHDPLPLIDTVPLMYQGASDDFLGPRDPVPLPDEEDGIDFEGEFGVVTEAVPMGTGTAAALDRVALVVLVNDWSLRGLGPHEMRTGFGFLQAKPSTSFAPVAVTPDELGPAWDRGRVHLRLRVDLNGRRFGAPHGREMHFGFGELIAHAARTRRLSAGTIIGSGTVSNTDRAAGSTCIAERRVIEMLEEGTARTPFLRFGDRVRLEARYDDCAPGPFGAIDQEVVRAPVPRRMA